jgi:hypothetical protein
LTHLQEVSVWKALVQRQETRHLLTPTSTTTSSVLRKELSLLLLLLLLTALLLLLLLLVVVLVVWHYCCKLAVQVCCKPVVGLQRLQQLLVWWAAQLATLGLTTQHDTAQHSTARYVSSPRDNQKHGLPDMHATCRP